MKDRSRYGSSIAFLDFLFNLVLTFVVITILLIVIMKKETSKPSIENKNEFVIIADWDDNTSDDVDVWLRDPSGRIVGFPLKEQPGAYLQRDDVGVLGEVLQLPDGSSTVVNRNTETINITAWQPGTYTVNIHFYKPDFKPEYAGTEVTVTVRVMKVNPFQELAPAVIKLNRSSDVGMEVTALNFTLDEKGNVQSVDRLQNTFVSEWRKNATPEQIISGAGQ